MALASPSDLASFLQGDVDTATATLVLDGASAGVLRAVQDLQLDPASVWTSGTVPGDVKLIVLQAAARAMDNPVQNTGETIGAISRQVRVTGVTLTPDEITACRIAAGELPGDTTMAVSLRPRHRSGCFF